MYSLYKNLTRVLAPVLQVHLNRRVRRGKEDKTRLAERRGKSQIKRPQGFVLWCHAASVGEAKSLLAFISRIRKAYPKVNILVTTGTVTSARVMAKELPKGVIHQFAPLDVIGWVRRFLNHWQPDLVVWLESELWPNVLKELEKSNVPRILLNGRMSEKSFEKWKYAPALVRDMVQGFSLIFTQTAEDERRFIRLGADKLKRIENLKYANLPLEADEKQLKVLEEKLRKRNVWVAASTHPGEEEMVAATHAELSQEIPNLLTVIIPRHPERGDEIVETLSGKGLILHQRSQKQTIQRETDLYIADTLGELGLFYRLSEIVFLGGSLTPIGGHNILEPAQLLCAVIVGPHMDNQKKLYQDFKKAGAILSVKDGAQLTRTVADLFVLGAQRKTIIRSGSRQAKAHLDLLDIILEGCEPFLPTPKKEAP